MNFLKRNRLAFLIFGAVGLWSVLLFAQSQNQGSAVRGLLQPWRVQTATNTATIPASQLGGLLIGTPTGAATYTTDTATNICNQFFGVPATPPTSNRAWTLVIRNVSAGANTITLAGGTGVTLQAGNTNTVAQAHTRSFLFFPQSCGSSPAIQVFSLQDSAH